MKVQKGEAMKTKWWKKACIGLFVVAMLMNLTVYFDSAGERSSDLNLGNLNVNLFQKAYGYTIEVPGICVYNPNSRCILPGISLWDHKE
jgi:hypothetical protein